MRESGLIAAASHPCSSSINRGTVVKLCICGHPKDAHTEGSFPRCRECGRQICVLFTAPEEDTDA